METGCHPHRSLKPKRLHRNRTHHHHVLNQTGLGLSKMLRHGSSILMVTMMVTAKAARVPSSSSSVIVSRPSPFSPYWMMLRSWYLVGFHHVQVMEAALLGCQRVEYQRPIPSGFPHQVSSLASSSDVSVLRSPLGLLPAKI